MRRSAKRLRAVIDDLVRRILAEIRGEGQRRAMSAGDLDRAGMDAVAISNEAVVLFMPAGYETTATMAWCWFLCSRSGQRGPVAPRG